MYEVDPTSVEEASASPAPAGAGRPGAPADPRRLWLRVRGGRRWIGGALVLGLVLAQPVARWLAPYEYLATTTVVWAPPPGMGAASAEAERELRTMVDQIELPANLAKVRRRLHLRDPIAVVGSYIEVLDFDQASNVITVAGRADAPRAAARLANTAVDVFLEYRRGLEGARRREAVRALEADLQRARAELAGARRRHDAFRAEHGITDLSLDTQQAIEHAAEMRAQADLARAETAAEEARTKALSGEVRRLAPTSVTETVIEQPQEVPGQDRLRQARLELAEARTRYTPDHPALEQLEARVRSLEGAAERPEGPATSSDRVVTTNPQYEALMGTLVGSAAQRDVAARRQRQLQKLAQAAEESLRRLSAIEGQASSLLAAQRVAEAHVAEIETLRARAADQARQPSAGLDVLARAAPPESPTSRVGRVITAAAIPLGGTLAVVLLLLGGALRGLRAWTAREVAYWGRGPVVGSSLWPRAQDALGDLLAELEDVTPDAQGATLVVGATQGDTDLARDLAGVLQGFYAWPGAPVSSEAPADDEPSATPGTYKIVDAARKAQKKRRKGGREHSARVESSSRALSMFRRGDLARETAERAMPDGPRSAYQAWEGPTSGPVLRRACRLADRVLVVVRSGSLSFSELGKMPVRLGREDGIGYLVVNLRYELTTCPDRAGPVAEFWLAARPAA